MVSRFLRAYPPIDPAAVETSALWLPFRGDELVVCPGESGVCLLRGDQAADLRFAGEPLYLGTLDGVPCLAVELSEPPNGDRRTLGLRALYGQISDETEYGLAGYAAQLLHWRRVSRFCPACGHPTEPETGSWGRRCANPDCGLVRYPQVSPAVLVLVHDGGDGILLARKPGWGRRYSILAGFVEPGESLEECVRRETLEESGVLLADLVYAGSQPWPFPHQLMIGFTARWTEGDIRIDEAELAEAAWFSAGALPELPPPLSLSRQMIDAWAASRQSAVV
jgi:NAD+ diphosphatase